MTASIRYGRKKEWKNGYKNLNQMMDEAARGGACKNWGAHEPREIKHGKHQVKP
jgi:hypothetical protein